MTLTWNYDTVFSLIQLTLHAVSNRDMFILTESYEITTRIWNYDTLFINSIDSMQFRYKIYLF